MFVCVCEMPTVDPDPFVGCIQFDVFIRDGTTKMALYVSPMSKFESVTFPKIPTAIWFAECTTNSVTVTA